MNKIILIHILIFICFQVTNAQEYKYLQDSVLKNNLYFKSYQAQSNLEIYEKNTKKILENPEVKLGFFPGSPIKTGPKKVFEISQKFSFPTTYIYQNKIKKQTIEKVSLENKIAEQEVKAKATAIYIELVSLYKKLEVYKNQIEDHKVWEKSIEIKLEKGDATILDLHKAKRHYSELKYNYSILLFEIDKNLKRIKLLNGSKAIDLKYNSYPDYNSFSLDSAKAIHLNRGDSALNISNQISINEFKKSKNELLPAFSIGFGIEQTPDESFKGIVVGMEIPIWGNAKKIKKAKIKQMHSKSEQLNDFENHKNQIDELVIYITKMEKFLFENKNLIETDQDLKYLTQMFDLGEISVLQLVNEKEQYFSQAILYLETEKKYYLALNQLFKYYY